MSAHVCVPPGAIATAPLRPLTVTGAVRLIVPVPVAWPTWLRPQHFAPPPMSAHSWLPLLFTTSSTIVRPCAAVTVVENGARHEYAALPADVVDPTGAGDALAAGFLVGGIELGLEAASRCVAQAGAMP